MSGGVRVIPTDLDGIPDGALVRLTVEGRLWRDSLSIQPTYLAGEGAARGAQYTLVSQERIHGLLTVVFEGVAE